MSRRTDHSREQLEAMALRAARRVAAEDGIRAVTARRIAAEVGCAPSTLRSLFESVDELMTRLRGEMLDELFVDLASVTMQGDPEATLIAFADHYVEYVSRHRNLWNVMFDNDLQDEIGSYRDKTENLLNLTGSVLAPLIPEDSVEGRLHHAQVLWAALDGIISAELSGKLMVRESGRHLVRSLITTYVAGLIERGSRGHGLRARNLGFQRS